MSVNLGTLKAYLGLDINKMLSGLSSAKSAMSRAGAQMSSMGRSMTMSLSAPIAALGTLFVKSASDFQAAMRKSNTMAGLGAEMLNEYSSEIVRISNMTGKSAVELADALYVVASAGQRGKEAMEIVESSAKAAAIGLGETKLIAKSVTATLNAYGKENITAARATEILLETVNQGNAEAEEIAPVIGRVVGMAASLGISMEEVGGSIATFTRLGVDAAEAVTGLRGIMNSLLKPLDEGNEAFKEAGYSLTELKTKIRKDGLAAALIDLVQRFKGNEEALADIVPNVRALAALFGTAGVQAKGYTKIMQSLNSDLHQVDTGFTKISQDSGFLFAKTMTELKNAGMELGLMLLPTFTKILKGVRDLVSWFSTLSTSTKNWILAMVGLVAALGPAVYVLGTIATVLGVITSEIGLVVVAALALAAGIYYLYDNWDALKERVSDWSWWKNAIIQMYAWMLKYNPIALLIDGLNYLAEKFSGEIIENPFDLLAEGLEELKDNTVVYEHQFKSLGETIDGIKEKVKGLFNMNFGGGGFSNILADLDPKTPSATGIGLPSQIETFRNSFNLLVAQVRTGTTQLKLDLMSVNSGIDQVANRGLTMATVFSGVITESFSGLGNAMVSGLDEGKSALDSFKEFFISWVKNMIAKMITLIITSLILAAVLSMLGFGAVSGGSGIASVAKGGMGFGKSLTAFLGAGASGGSSGTGFKGLASGGFVNEGGIFKVHKQELITLPSGSAVTPANMARGGGSNGGRLYTEISGRTLRIILDEEDRRTGNTYG